MILAWPIKDAKLLSNRQGRDRRLSGETVASRPVCPVCRAALAGDAVAGSPLRRPSNWVMMGARCGQRVLSLVRRPRLRETLRFRNPAVSAGIAT